MPSIFRPVTAERAGARPWIGVVACVLALGLTTSCSEGQSSPAAESNAHTIRIENMTFTPSQVKVRRGDRVTFKNLDLVPHTATARPASVFNSGVLNGGETWSYTVATECTIRYTCTFHPMMEGTLVVESR